MSEQEIQNVDDVKLHFGLSMINGSDDDDESGDTPPYMLAKKASYRRQSSIEMTAKRKRSSKMENIDLQEHNSSNVERTNQYSLTKVKK